MGWTLWLAGPKWISLPLLAVHRWRLLLVSSSAGWRPWCSAALKDKLLVGDSLPPCPGPAPASPAHTIWILSGAQASQGLFQSWASASESHKPFGNLPFKPKVQSLYLSKHGVMALQLAQSWGIHMWQNPAVPPKTQFGQLFGLCSRFNN